MKYPLAVVRRLLDEFGSDICLGYDIMCAFWTTLLKSSLGSEAVAFRLHGIVPAFHGHAHNRGCQVQWHPLYVEGVGLEDFEECERTFCRSNELASVTRLSTPYHRQQHIDEHFHFHNIEKHASSSELYLSVMAVTSDHFYNQGTSSIRTTGRPSNESRSILHGLQPFRQSWALVVMTTNIIST
jgi:hypothetical protein